MQKKIQYVSDLSQVIEENNVDIFFTSGTIQYLPDPYAPLEKIAVSEVPIVALTRNNFSCVPKIVSQRSSLSENGAGRHFEKYGNPYIYYPNTELNKSTIIGMFVNGGYEIVIDTSGNTSGVYGKDNFSGDIVMVKK